MVRGRVVGVGRSRRASSKIFQESGHRSKNCVIWFASALLRPCSAARAARRARLVTTSLEPKAACSAPLASSAPSQRRRRAPSARRGRSLLRARRFAPRVPPARSRTRAGAGARRASPENTPAGPRRLVTTARAGRQQQRRGAVLPTARRVPPAATWRIPDSHHTSRPARAAQEASGGARPRPASGRARVLSAIASYAPSAPHPLPRAPATPAPRARRTAPRARAAR